MNQSERSSFRNSNVLFWKRRPSFFFTTAGLRVYDLGALKCPLKPRRQRHDGRQQTGGQFDTQTHQGEKGMLGDVHWIMWSKEMFSRHFFAEHLQKASCESSWRSFTSHIFTECTFFVFLSVALSSHLSSLLSLRSMQPVELLRDRSAATPHSALLQVRGALHLKRHLHLRYAP